MRNPFKTPKDDRTKSEQDFIDAVDSVLRTGDRLYWEGDLSHVEYAVGRAISDLKAVYNPDSSEMLFTCIEFGIDESGLYVSFVKESQLPVVNPQSG